ncbi:MAG: hypothetical protein ACLQRM_16365 [Acidimicrobiales bacterium]
MTIIATFCSPERVLIAADGMAVFTDPYGHSPPNAVRFEKIRPIGDQPLVFGMIGPSEPRDEMDEWLRGKHPSTWQQFARILNEEVSRKNGTLRASIRSAGLDPSREQGSQVVVAGFLDVPGVAIAQDNGRFGYSDEKGTRFFGLYDGIARVALHVSKSINPRYEPNTAKKLHGFLDTLCTHLPELLHPVDVWEITPGSAPERRY